MPLPAARLLATLGFVGAVAVATARGADAPTAPEPYFSHPDMAALKLSPSGKRIGALARVAGRQVVVVMDTDDRKLRIAASVEGEDVGSFAWVNDDRLVVTLIDLTLGSGEQRGGAGLYAVDHDGSNARRIGERQGRRYTRLFQALSNGSDDILAVSNDRNASFPDVYRIDTRTGRRELLTFDRPGDPARWVADRNGVVRAVVTVDRGTNFRSWWRSGADAKWQLIGEYNHREAGVIPVDFDGDGTMIVASNLGRDTYALYRFDAARNMPGALVAAHPHVDLLGGLLWDAAKGRIVGIAYDAAKPGHAWFDDDWARLSAAVDRAMPGCHNAVSRGQSGRALVWSRSDRDPGTWYLLDVADRKLEYLASARKAIDAKSMPARTPLRYKARDGLEIPAYLTLPAHGEAKALPLVLYVHGGPYVRGSNWTWRPEPAYLAAHGFAVLEPEFRGSTGWGGTLHRKGWRQWGRGMQDDLIDGIDFVAAQGIVDPKRVCIMGASYGGYAVMMGLARDPERFRCGVNYLGVTDIQMLFDVTWSDTFDSDFMRYNAKELIGDPDREADWLREVSPLQNAARIRSPVLMAYGGGDRRVPLVHGERMRDALERQGTPVEWVVYSDEGHGFLREENRYDFHRRVTKFLAEHLR